MLGSGLCRGPGEADTRAFLEDTGSTEHVERGTAPDQIWCSDPSPLDRIDVMSSKECEEEFGSTFQSRFSDYLPILFSIQANDSTEQQADPPRLPRFTGQSGANGIGRTNNTTKKYFRESKRSEARQTKRSSHLASLMTCVKQHRMRTKPATKGKTKRLHQHATQKHVFGHQR